MIRIPIRNQPIFVSYDSLDLPLDVRNWVYLRSIQSGKSKDENRRDTSDTRKLAWVLALDGGELMHRQRVSTASSLAVDSLAFSARDQNWFYGIHCQASKSGKPPGIRCA